jgi:hypothetical protein
VQALYDNTWALTGRVEETDHAADRSRVSLMWYLIADKITCRNNCTYITYCRLINSEESGSSDCDVLHAAVKRHVKFVTVRFVVRAMRMQCGVV